MLEGPKDRPGMNFDIKFIKDRMWNNDTQKACLKVKYINKTGSASVKGTIVQVYDSTAIDFAVDLVDAGGSMPVGAIAEDGIADGEEVFVVVSGSALVLMENTVSAVRNYWCGVSGTAGRADASASVPAATTHFKELGHFVESVTGGTNVLAEIIMHFN